MPSAAIEYSIQALDTKGHYFAVELRIAQPDPEGQQLRLPAWLPGSYMIRDFAKHVVTFEAYCEDQVLAVMRLDKQQWQLQPCEGPVTVRYQVYAWDLSVRTAYLDDDFGFYNHSALCLEVVGQAQQPCQVEILTPTHQPHWQLATGMTRLTGQAFESGTFIADNYEQLIDYPVLMGDLTLDDFIVHGTRHRIAISGRHHADMDRISADLANICETQLEMFDDEAPFEHYTFLVMVVGNGFGGLEHRNSTALLCSRKDLIHAGQQGTTDSYRTFLSLCSHEYFHAWNVKRLRPREFIPFHLQREQYTEQLWFYEGVTSYYDDLFVHRAGIATPQQYLDVVGQTLTRALMGKGVERQTLVESSRLAWTTFYQQNENAPNAIASYYSKGSVVALCCDLMIRQQSDGRYSLDDVMRTLWMAYGKDERGTTMDCLLDTLTEFGGDALRSFLHRALFTCEPLPVEDILQQNGITVKRSSAEGENGPFGKAPRIEMPVALGARFHATDKGIQLLQVFEGGAAYQAGLAANDVIVAIDRLQISAANQLEFWSRYQPGDSVEVHAFRRDELKQLTLTWQAPAQYNWSLSVDDDSQLRGWLSVARRQQ